MTTTPSTQVTTGKVRLSFVNLFRPKAMVPGAEEKYSVTILIPKSDTDTLNRIYTAIETAKQKGLNGSWAGSMPPAVPNPLHDGDGVKENGEPYGQECKGHMVMTASSKVDYPPEVVDQNLNPIINPTEIYSGCYGRVNINFFPYGGGQTGYKKGIGAGLGPVQKIADGEALGGKAPEAADVFTAVGNNQTSNKSVSNKQIDPITGLPM